jgi:Na+/H+ antiporter NhaA
MSRHNLGHPKAIEKNTQNSGSHITMKKVIHGFLIPLAHAISVHHDDVLPPKIIQWEDLA